MHAYIYLRISYYTCPQYSHRPYPLQVAAQGAVVGSRPTRRALGRDWQLGYLMIAPVFLVIVGLIA